MIDRITTIDNMVYPSDKLIRRTTSTQIMVWDACASVTATPPGPQIKSNTAEKNETNTKIQMDRCIASSGRNELRLECLHAGSSVQSGLRGQSK